MRMLPAISMALLATCGAAAAGQNCTCRANGQSYYEGEILCIRGKLSRCEMNLNVTSWKVIADICPEAKAPKRTKVARAEKAPRVAAAR
jgi:hypothetical protein